MLVGTGLAGLGMPYALHVALWVLLGAARSPSSSGSSPSAGRGAGAGGRRHDAAVPGSAAVTRLTARLTDAGFAAGWALVRLLPEPAARAAFDGAALGGRRRGQGRPPAARQPAASPPAGGCPRPSSTPSPGAAVRSYARYWQEAFRLPAIDPGRIVGDTATVGERAPSTALRAEGAAIVLALPHSGNWDAAGVWWSSGWAARS